MPCQGDHGPLGRAVHRAGDAQLCGDGGHRDNIAVALLQHNFTGRAGDGHGALHVDVGDKIIVSVGKFLDGLQALFQHTGAVYQHVDPPEGLHCLAHQFLIVLRAGDVSLDKDGLAALLFDFFQDLVLIGVAHIRQNQLCAFTAENLSGLHADTGVAAGDDTHFPVQSSHSLSLRQKFMLKEV